MSFNTEEFQSTVSDILQEALKMLDDNYQENILDGKRSIVKEFLDALVSCGEMTSVNRLRIEENPELKDFFHQPTDMDLDNDVSVDTNEGQTTTSA